MAGGAIKLTAEVYHPLPDDVAPARADYPDMYVRACYPDMDRIGAASGGVVEIAGVGRALARCIPAAPLSPAGRILIPSHVLGALGIGNGVAVMVRKAAAPAARSVTLAPLGPVPAADGRYLAGRLLGVPVARGAALDVRYFDDPNHRVRFRVASVSPSGGPAVVSARTDVRVALAGRLSRAVPPAQGGMPRGMAADAGRIRAALEAALDGRGAAGAPGGAVCEAKWGAARFLVRAAAGACGAHLAEVDGSSLHWAASAPGRRERAREHARRRKEDPGQLRRMLESRGLEEVRWEPSAPEVKFFRSEARRTFEMAAERAPSVIMLDLSHSRLGDAGPPLASMIGRIGQADRVALVALSAGPGALPEWLAGRAVEVAAGGRRRPGQGGG